MENQQQIQVNQTKNKNGLGIASLVLGIIAISGSWVPLLNVISIITAIIGIFLGIWSLINVVCKKCTGLAMSIISIILGIASVFIAFNMNNQVFGDSEKSTLVSKNKTSSQSDNNSTSKTNENSQSSDDTQQNGEQTLTYNVGDTIAFDNKEVTITKVEKKYSTGNQFVKPKSGKQFVKATVKIVNNDKLNINVGPSEFKLQDSNGVLNNGSNSIHLDDALGYFSELAPGGNITGSLLFEAPEKDENLKLIYQPSFWSSKKIEIKI